MIKLLPIFLQYLYMFATTVPLFMIIGYNFIQYQVIIMMYIIVYYLFKFLIILIMTLIIVLRHNVNPYPNYNIYICSLISFHCIVCDMIIYHTLSKALYGCFNVIDNQTGPWI